MSSKRVVAVLTVLAISVSVLVTNAFAATNYTYSTNTTPSVKVSAIVTAPSNIKLIGYSTVSSRKNLAGSGMYGINGGYYNFGNADIYNIAMQDGKPVSSQGYCDGSTNNSYTRGTIYYDGTALKFTKVKYASDIVGINKVGTWAQGGVSMSLGDSNWKTIINSNNENLSNPDSPSGRSAMAVYGGKVYLIVAESDCTATVFRANILKWFGMTDTVGGTSTTKFAIFLDGSGSSQLKCAEKSITGDSRLLGQIISLKLTN